ncbi:hypothetical protein ACIA8I_41345 [Streptomyces rishiriensis]|uniref:hypothetical protein n=1 Tax=Streptomyces rishiriensis TaxID=68264 RepID=UPI0037B2A8F8
MSAASLRPRQCLECMNWGLNYNCCDTCRRWRQKQPTTARCRRCGHTARVSTAEQVCRPCLRAIRSERDFEWLADPDGCRPRDRQLSLIFPGLNGKSLAQPLSRPGRNWDTARLIQRLGGGQEAKDDPAFSPPALPGQMLLFSRRRVLGHLAEARIEDRVLTDWDLVEPVLVQRAADLGYGKGWVRQVGGVVRVMLALRESDGGGLIPVEALESISAMRQAAAEVLQQAGILDVPDGWTAPPMIRGIRPARPRSCRSCQAWGLRSLCPGCRGWRDNADQFDEGDCTRCKREGVLLRDGLCRGCCLDITLNGLQTRHQPWRQLMFGSPFTFHTTVHLAHVRHEAGSPGFQRHWKRSPEPERTTSAHRLVPGQEPLFPMARDWSRIATLPLTELPLLTPGDEELVTALLEEAQQLQWREGPVDKCVRAVRVLASWLGTDAPIPEEDIRTLSAATPRSGPGPRLAQFLARRDRLVLAQRTNIDAGWVESAIAQYNGDVPDELRTWVKVLRGGGRWEHSATTWVTIRRYLGYLKPALTNWQAVGVTTLREISREEMNSALKARKGRKAEAFHSAARSLFRALKQERVIFADPTRGLTVTAVEKVPRPIPSDVLKGVIERTPMPAHKLIVALVAVHALGLNEITRLPASALNLSDGRLTVRRPGRRHLVYLDELTYELAAEWMRERHRLWPMSSNPHLLVNRFTAMNTDAPPISRSAIKDVFTVLGLSGQKVRIDRMLHEAQLTADPLHLIRLFGISEVTAVRYVHAAHPERTGKTLR